MFATMPFVADRGRGDQRIAAQSRGSLNAVLVALVSQNTR